jgi:hypothetical protein
MKSLEGIMLEAFYGIIPGLYSVKHTDGGSILSLSQFLLLPQQPLKIMLAIKMVKIDFKIIVLPP